MEYRVFGPPGTGKTKFLTGQIARARDMYDYDAVLAATLTRTAGNVLIGRSVELNPDHIGTLHHICYRLLGCPPIAETYIEEWWNEEFPLQRMDSSAKSRRVIDDDEEEETTGKDTSTDLAYQDYQLRRARMLPRQLWTLSTLLFAEQWEGWKQKHGLTDFTDMIECAWKEHPKGPEGIRCGFLDEVQDMDKLSLTCFRSWAEQWEYCFIAGDDDQALYEWRGSTPDAFLEPVLPKDQMIVLPQSYRIPAAVHRVAQTWIEQISYRQPKPYRPRAEEGEVRGLQCGYSYPEPILQDMAPYFQEKKRVMFLTSCNYMLKSMLYVLRREGIPFHNPLRPSNGSWNPLASRRGIRTADRLLAFLSPDPDMQHEEAGIRMSWSYTDLARWVEMVKTDGVLQWATATKGTRKKKGKSGAPAPAPSSDGRVEMAALEGETEVPLVQLAQWFEPQALQAALALDLDWLASVLTSRFVKVAEYPTRVILKQGPRALLHDPLLIVGTTHSVKGGEADVTYLCPDISFAAASEWESRRRDPIIRQFYVGMTRAKESLVVCTPATNAHVSGLLS
jgi:superfamily I DNA/RNA helicase